MNEFDLSLGLLGLYGALAFTLGFLLGMQVFAAVLRERERQISRERRAINRVRRYLRQHHGVELPTWTAHVTDKKEMPLKRRHWFRRKG